MLDAPCFSLVPQRRPRPLSLGVSFGIQVTVVLILTQLGLVQPQQLLLPKKLYTFVPLVSTPPPQKATARPPKNMVPVVPPKLTARVVPPTVIRPTAMPPEAKVLPPTLRPEVRNTAVANVVPVPSVPKMQILRTGVFTSTGSQAVPTTSLPARKVQTGGFGDPNGVKAEGKPGTRGNIAAVGSFDLPSGPGYGNGTGGSRGVRGTVASVGFGNGIAIGNSNQSHPGDGHHVQQGSFATVQPVADAPRAPRLAPATATSTAVQITSKPNPVYTQEARALKLEGEVLLQVTFTANGECRVHQVVRGLGHGLDEAAVRAAQQIKFRPATRDGHAVDSTATLHVLFQLAY